MLRFSYPVSVLLLLATGVALAVPPTDSLGYYDNGIWGHYETLGMVGGSPSPYWAVAFDQGVTEVDSVAVFTSGESGHNDAVFFEIWDDAGGQPGSVLWTSNMVFINDSFRRWYQTKPPAPVPVTGKFYVATYPFVNSAGHILQHWDNNGRQSPPNTQWQNDGSWTPDTHEGDLMIRCYANIHNVGVAGIVAPAGMVDSGDYLVPACSLRNYGDYIESYKVKIRIGSFYTESTTVWYQAPGNVQTASFRGVYVNLPLGTYTVSCTTFLPNDANHSDDGATGTFTVRPYRPDAGWGRLADLQVKWKTRVRDGGALAAAPGDSNQAPGPIYAFKRNHRRSLYAYSLQTGTWDTLEQVPRLGRSGQLRMISRGASLAFAGGALYATKGNHTLEFWQYAPVSDTWIQLADVPAGSRYVMDGASATGVTLGETSYVYFLKGSRTREFYRFNTRSGAWLAQASAPAGVSGRNFGEGSCLAFDNDSTVYALKGPGTEFYAYNVRRNSWITRASLPLRGHGGAKATAKSGAALAWLGGRVYALKGGNTLGMWVYDPVADTWAEAPDMPVGGGRKVSKGGALTAADGLLFALKGNNTNEFYAYAPVSDFGGQVTGFDAAGGSSSAIGRPTLTVSPNPFSDFATVNYSLPRVARVGLSLYDVTGKRISILVDGYQAAGDYSVRLGEGRTPARGVYMLRLEADGWSESRKLIVE